MRTAPPDWTVIYFDEAKCAVLPFGSACHLFEYEITSEMAAAMP
ncbi:MAG TPA: hypothetical protein VIL65_06515 [Beijerinckiaceae bacterium]